MQDAWVPLLQGAPQRRLKWNVITALYFYTRGNVLGSFLAYIPISSRLNLISFGL